MGHSEVLFATLAMTARSQTMQMMASNTVDQTYSCEMASVHPNFAASAAPGLSRAFVLKVRPCDFDGAGESMTQQVN